MGSTKIVHMAVAKGSLGWTPLSSFDPVPMQCLPPAWYLGSEIYFSLITTPVLILLVKKARLSMYILSFLGFMSSLLMYGAILNIDPVDLRSLNSFSNDMSTLLVVKYTLIYQNPNHRFISVSGGLMCGYFLYYYDFGSRKWPTWFTNSATKISIAALATISASHFALPLIIEYDLHNSLPDNHFAHLAVTLRAVWAIANCVVLLRLVTDWQDSPIVRLLSGRLGCMMSKINLAALLIHMDLLFLHYVFKRDLRENFSLMRWYQVFLLTYVNTIILSALIHVFVESPINKLVRYCLQGRTKEFNSKKQS